MSYYPNPLQQLIPPRASSLMRRLRRMLWENRRDLDVQGGPVNETPIPLEETVQQPLQDVRPGETFAGPGNQWKQRWFKVTIPAAEKDEVGRRVLFWDSQGETTVYLNGTPWAGIDIAHRYCTLPDEACELWLDTGTYQTGVWFGGPKSRVDEYGCRFDGAWIACRNEAAWKAYWDVSCLNDLMTVLLKRDDWSGHGVGFHEPLDEVSVLLRRLLRGFDTVCNAFDAGGFDAIGEPVKQIYNDVRAAPWQGKAAMCGHAHIDLVWLWPESEGDRKAVHSFSTVLRLMDRYPEFRFMYSQPAAYHAVKRLAPELYDQVVEKIRDGQWEATGGFEVECDVNLPCGEALARCMSLGQKRFAELRGGEISRNVWIPDVFGYSNCLPQIMKLGGITSFFTTKMTWSNITRFPHNAFMWRGADGAEILTFLCPVSYNERVEIGTLIRSTQSNRQSGVYDTALLPQGIGDGGGGPREEMCERARRFADLAEVPQTRWAGVEEFFEGLRTVADKLPVYQGELYLEMHRGTYTTQAQLKHQYRAAERGLQAHEACRVFMGQGAIPEADWLRLCFSQFHDALPGSSIGLVYEELTPELQQIAERQLAEARKTLMAGVTTTGGGAEWIFNPVAVARPAVIESSSAPEDGSNDSCQTLTKDGDKRVLKALQLPALGAVAAADAAVAADTPEVTGDAGRGVLDNGLVQAYFSEQGKLQRLVVDGEELALSQPAEFVMYPDYPVAYDAWDIDRHTLQLGSACADNLTLELAAAGPVRATLEAETALGDSSRMRVSYTLDAGRPYLFVELDVDWQESRKLLKYHLLTDYRGQMARYGGPFGSTRRPQLPGYPGDESQWEVPASRWAAVTNDTETSGAAVITEAKYGFSCRNGNLGLSLLRATVDPDEKADRGRHRIRFAVGLHRTRTEAGRFSTAVAAESLFAPTLSFKASETPPRPPFALDNLGSLVPSWVSPADNGSGWILRAHETAGERGSAVLELTDPPRRVTLIDFLGNEQGSVESLGGNRYRIDYAPYQIISIYVR